MDKQKKIETNTERTNRWLRERSTKAEERPKRGRLGGTSRCKKNESQYGNVQREEYKE